MIYSSGGIRAVVLAVGKLGIAGDRVQGAQVLGVDGPGTAGCQLGNGMEL